jgi:hypothetical protein
MSNTEAIICILISLLIGSFWSVIHYFLLTKFSVDKIVSCTEVKWNENGKISIVFDIISVIFFNLLPIFIFIFTNYKIILFVSISLQFLI